MTGGMKMEFNKDLNKDNKMMPPPTQMQLQRNSPQRSTMAARAKASRTMGASDAAASGIWPEIAR